MSEHDNPIAPSIPDHDLLARIGEGAYGDVWLARNIMGDFRAVKVVRRDRFESSRPFDREFEGIKKFEPVSRTHESQLDVLHIGRNGGYFYYVMEVADDVLRGRNIDPEHYAPHTLRSDILERGRLPFDECLQIALSLTTALAHLHSNGLVHRDIKPSNVIFVNGQPKLADIGLVTDLDATMTMVGTEGYLPPEGPGKPSADLYSLGKVLYEISTGLDRTEFPELPTGQHLHEDRERFAELNELITKACSTDPGRRYETAAEMREDLLQIQAGGSLIRSRQLERRLQFAKKAAAIGGILLVLAGSGYLYQRHQTEKANQLTQDLQKATDDLEAKTTEAKLSAANAIKANYTLHNQNAIRFMKEGDLQEAALWSHSALQFAEPASDQAWAQQYRLNTLLTSLPEVLDYIDASAFNRNLSKLVSIDENSADYLVNRSPDILIIDSLTGEHKKKIDSVTSGSSSLLGDGKLLEADFDSKWFRTREIDSGKTLTEFEMPAHLNRYETSNGGKLLFTVTKGGTNSSQVSSYQCFDTATGTQKWKYECTQTITSASQSKNGKIVALCLSDGVGINAITKILLIDGNSGTVLDELEQAGLMRPDILMDGQTLLYIVIGPVYSLKLFARSIRDGKLGEPRQIDGSFGGGMIHIPGNDTYLIVATKYRQVHPGEVFLERGNSIKVYDLETSSVKRSLPELASRSISRWELGPNERFIAVTTEQNEIWLYDLVNGEDWQQIMKFHVEPIRLKFTSIPGRLLVTGSDKSVRLLKIPLSSTYEHADLLNLELATQSSIHWNPNSPNRAVFVGKTNSTQSHESVYQLDLQSLQFEPLVPTTNHISVHPHSIAINAHSNIVALGTATNGLEIWNLSDRQRIYHDDRYTNLLHQLKWSASGDMLAGATMENKVFVLKYGAIPSYVFEHDFNQFAPRQNLIYPAGIAALEWDPKGEFLFASQEDVQLIWDAHAFELLSARTNSGTGNVASFSPNGEWLSVNGSFGASIFARSNGFSMQQPTMLHGPATYLPHLSWSPESDALATVQLSIFGDGQAHVWKLKARPDGDDGTRVIGTNVGRIISFDESSGDRALKHDIQVTTVAFGPNGRLLASGDTSGKVNIWHAKTTELLVTIENTGGGINRLSFSPNGEFLLYGMEDNTFRFHKLRNVIEDSEISASRLRLLCGGTYSDQGLFIPANRDQLLLDLEIAKKPPSFFQKTRSMELVNWYASQLRVVAFQGDVSDPLSHVEQLLILQPDQSHWRSLKERLINSAIPPRDNDLPARMIDLTDFYNANLHEASEGTVNGGISFGGRNNLAELGARVHRFGKTDFDIRGIVHVAANPEYEESQDLFNYPAKVSGISLQQKGRALDFIHGGHTPWGLLGVPTGTEVGAYVVHFQDGSTERIPLVQNQNIGDWWFDPTSASELPEAEIAWSGECAATRLDVPEPQLRLFKFSWTNPAPNKLISHIDLESAQRATVPFLLAITAEPVQTDTEGKP